MVLDEHILILDKLLVSSLQITLALVRKVNLYRSLMSTSDSIADAIDSIVNTIFGRIERC